MAYEAKVLADSISNQGVRLTTLEVTFPRFILPEFNTHRVFSRNSSSSRAVPVKKQLERIKNDPFIPEYWGKNQPGMEAESVLSDTEAEQAKTVWLGTRDNMLESARILQDLGVHKEVINRLLEPFAWHTAIVTATEWSNFFALRINKSAQPEMQKTASDMAKALDDSRPQLLKFGQWHLPLIQPDELEWAGENPDDAIKVSVGRCARVSYLTHDGKRDPATDIALHDRLLANGHMSPFEHVATPDPTGAWHGNFRGWIQYRKTIKHEDDYSKR